MCIYNFDYRNKLKIFNKKKILDNKLDKENFEFSHLLLNEINVIVVSCDKNGQVNFVSQATEKIIGYKAEDLTVDKWWEKTYFLAEESITAKHKVCDIILGKTKINSKAYERKLKCADGSYKWIEWRDSLSKDNTFVMVGVDITDWKLTEELKIQSATIIESVDSMILVSDVNGNVIFSSPSVEKTLGYTAEDIEGDKWWKVTYDNKHQANKVKKAVYNHLFLYIKDFTDIYKREIKTKNGDYKWIEWQFSRGLNDTYISVGTDITSRINSEIELKEAKETAEKLLKVKDEFLANMSHEIRTPLNAIIGFTDLLLESELSKEQAEHLQTMRNSGEILLSLINNVLDLAKLDSNKVEIENISFNLHKSLAKIVKLMRLKAEEKGIELELKIDPNTPKKVIGDPTRLDQILLNLIGNAIKFTNEGSVMVYVSLVESLQGTSKIHFEISDTGIGIIPNKINTVFGVFTQAKSDTSRIYGGTGLGLAIVKKLVTLLKGDISVESKFGKGSNFKMNLYFKNTAQEKTTEEQVESKITESLDLKILLVEDNKTNQFLAKTRLERWGCTVEIANNGIEGVKLAQKTPFDIILMDIQMPVMDGYEAAKIIKNDLPKKIAATPIIAMTAYTAKEDIDRAFIAGMNDYIFKPFVVKDLYNMLKKYGNLHKNQIIADFDEEIESKNEISTKYTDLKFLKEESLNESSILKLLIQMFIKDLEEFVNALDIGIKEKNWDLLHRSTHKIKPSVSMFGISKLEPIIHTLLSKSKKEPQLKEIKLLIKESKKIIVVVKNELIDELKILHDE